MKNFNFATLLGCLSIIALGIGWWLNQGRLPPEPLPEPTSLPVMKQYPVKRIYTGDLVQMRIFHVASPVAGVSITDTQGLTYLPVRKFISAAKAENLVKPNLQVVWFAPIVNGNRAQGAISIGSGGAQIDGCVLLNQTGYIPYSVATKYVDEDMIYVRSEDLLSDSDERQYAGKILDFELPD
jgi:hypothetical protein